MPPSWPAPTRPERSLPPDEPQEPRKPGWKWAAAIGALVLVFVVLAGYDLVTNRTALLAEPAASPSASHTVHARSPAPSASPSTTRASAKGLPSPSTTPSATARPVRELSAVSVAAFGPDGTSDGDNADLAARVLTGDGVNAWASAWYDSPAFGELQSGTGLLLDMGTEVSVSAVRLVLGDSAGADVEVRLGDTAGDPSDLTTAASASGVGGTVRLSPSSSVRTRYVLVWFTRLPPNNQGKYQVFVYSITVSGRR